MPKAKRSKVISLTKTKKKDKTLNKKILNKLQTEEPNYSNIYLLQLDNLNNEVQTLLRQEILGSFVFGKKKIFSKYFELKGNSDQNYKKFSEGIEQIKSETSQFCLLFTNESPEKIQQ